MKKLLSSILFGAFLSMNMANVVFAVNLAPNTPVVVQAESYYSSDSLNVGDEVLFSVVNTVTSDMGKPVIAQGAKVKAKVVQVNSKKRIGKPGKIQLSDFYTTAINGAQVPLTGAVVSKGKSKTGLSIGLSVALLPFFLLMKGEDTQIPQGAQYTLFTTSN